MAQHRMVWPNQYENAANPAAHFDGTGPELMAQCPDLDAVSHRHVDGRYAGGGVALPPSGASACDRRRG